MPQDDRQAVAWFRKAAEQGYAAAQDNLGTMYSDGRGVVKDDVAAVQWYRKAAEQGNASGQANLGAMSGARSRSGQRQGQALLWYHKVAAHGLAAAPLSLDAMERMAWVVTERDPRVKISRCADTLLLLATRDQSARILFRYGPPHDYVLFTSRAEDGAAYLSMADDRAVIYNVARGVILLLHDIVPTVGVGVVNNGLLPGWGFAGTKPETAEPDARVKIDFPSLLQMVKGGTRHAEDLGGGRYRLIYTKTLGVQVTLTVDLSSPTTFTGLELRSGDEQLAKLEIVVNKEDATITSALPEARSLRAKFKVEPTPMPEDLNGMSHLMFVMMFPLAIGNSSDGGKVHESVEKATGQKSTGRQWMRYKRDLPKLRQLLPMPQSPVVYLSFRRTVRYGSKAAVDEPLKPIADGRAIHKEDVRRGCFGADIGVAFGTEKDTGGDSGFGRVERPHAAPDEP